MRPITHLDLIIFLATIFSIGVPPPALAQNEAVPSTTPAAQATPPQADGLWTVSTAPADQPTAARTFQMCVTHAPTYMAQMMAYAKKMQAALKTDTKISNEVRTPTSQSYDFVTTMTFPTGGTLTQRGSSQRSFPDDKHRTQRMQTTAMAQGLPGPQPPTNMDTVTTSTWVSADCGDVKPTSVEDLPEPGWHPGMR
jgi:hypothetical protein